MFRLQALGIAVFTITSAAGATPPVFHTWDYFGDDDAFAYNVSGNGTVVGAEVHYFSSPFGSQAHRWTLGGPIQPLGIFGGIGSSNVEGLSHNGAVVVGYSKPQGGNREAYRWTAQNGMVGLGYLHPGDSTSEARDVSANGQVIVGSSGTSQSFEAYRYTSQSGMIGLGIPSGFNRTTATATSADGSVISGNAYTSNGASRPFRWTEVDGMTLLPLESGLTPFANDVSSDGTTIVGESGWRPYAWSTSGNFYLTDLNGHASATNDDGSIIVGEIDHPIGLIGGPPEAFIWDTQAGLRSVENYLQLEVGLNLNGFDIQNVTDISGDGGTIVGWGRYMGGDTIAFAAVVPSPAGGALLAIACGISRRRRFSS
jgi:probable HAF family extracellular repeat protein